MNYRKLLLNRRIIGYSLSSPDFSPIFCPYNENSLIFIYLIKIEKCMVQETYLVWINIGIYRVSLIRYICQIIEIDTKSSVMLHILDFRF